MKGVVRAGGEAEAAAGTALWIDAGRLAPKAVGAFRHQGQRMDGAGGDTATAAAAGRRDLEARVLLICHAALKNSVGLQQIFR